MNNFKEFLDKWGVENYDENALRDMSLSELLSMLHTAIREGTQVNTYIPETIQAVQAAVNFMDIINEKTDNDHFAIDKANSMWSQNAIWSVDKLLDGIFECNSYDFLVKVKELKFLNQWIAEDYSRRNQNV